MTKKFRALQKLFSAGKKMEFSPVAAIAKQKGRREAGLFASRQQLAISIWRRPGRPSRTGSSRRP
jgi:hypothetical protein